MYKTLLILLNLFSLPTAFAANDWCTYTTQSGVKESVQVKTWGDQDEVIQLRFKGPIPDRYFTLSKTEKPGNRHIYSEFAYRENAQSMLKLEAHSDSKLTVGMNLGGNSYYYHDGKYESQLVCPVVAPSATYRKMKRDFI